jgi:glucose-1-phosphate cytidylyltransferase
MIEIGGKPILWHIMKIYSAHGINDFVVCCGYKGYMIKEYFANYFLHMSDVTFDMRTNAMKIHKKMAEDWKVTLVDTGESTMTGGRLKRVEKYIDQEDFCLTYGDGVSDVNITDLIKFHHAHGKNATITAVQPPGRYGSLKLKGTQVKSFEEKPQGDGAYINGGFFVLKKEVIKLIKDENTFWEQEPLETLSKNEQLEAYRHKGFWQAMDTLRDRNHLEKLWDDGRAPWKVWE